LALLSNRNATIRSQSSRHGYEVCRQWVQGYLGQYLHLLL
jgi:hypothetical protein